MNDLAFVRSDIFSLAFAILPEHMDSTEARAELLTIGLQESRMKYRKQIGGPAKGLWQFEEGGGVRGVLRHPQTHMVAEQVCRVRNVRHEQAACYDALQHDDVFAACFARLLLWTLPGRLPTEQEANLGWIQYIDAWRPGLPHRETWDGFFRLAWAEVMK